DTIRGFIALEPDSGNLPWTPRLFVALEQSLLASRGTSSYHPESNYGEGGRWILLTNKDYFGPKNLYPRQQLQTQQPQQFFDVLVRSNNKQSTYNRYTRAVSDCKLDELTRNTLRVAFNNRKETKAVDVYWARCQSEGSVARVAVTLVEQAEPLRKIPFAELPEDPVNCNRAIL
ncbi:hypothetical protein BGX21_006454, partial [Mortierella sp. AD011]